MNEKLFISHQSWRFDFDVVISKALSTICTLTWRVNNYSSRQRKGMNRRKENTDGESFIITL